VLGCYYNELTSLDVSGCIVLDNLSCQGNQLTSLDVSYNIGLRFLYCEENQLTYLDVSNNIALLELMCGMNNLTSLDISQCPALYWLHCGCNGLMRCWGVENANLLINLNISNNISLTDINLTHISTLHEVCVWESFNPEDLFSVITSESPNVYFTTECAVGFDEQCLSDLSIYPNPTNRTLTIETDQPDLYSIEITSLNGQQILIGEMEGTTHQLDLSSFHKGVYLITIRSEDFVTKRKVIKL